MEGRRRRPRAIWRLPGGDRGMDTWYAHPINMPIGTITAAAEYESRKPPSELKEWIRVGKS